MDNSTGNDVTFIFDDEGKGYAVQGGKIVRASTDFDQLEAEPVAQPAPTPKKSARYIVTPNGLKGQILGRHQDMWGENVTVRFENGRIASFSTTAEELGYLDEDEAEALSPVAELEAQLHAEVDGTTDGLTARLKTLASIKHEAALLIQAGQQPYEDEQRLDEIVITAEYESSEVHDALEHLADAEPFAPPAPFETRVVEQESLGRSASWLDQTLGAMILEAESQDFDRLMAEGPELFVAELEDGALADTGTTRQMASALIRSKTAGIEAEAVEAFEKAFLARVEPLRQQELSNRKQKIAKQASAAEDHDGPAESLFL